MTHVSSPMLTGENYVVWKVKMETLLVSQNLWQIVSEGYRTYPEGEQLTDEQQNQLDENRVKDARALFMIQQGVAQNLFSRIITAKKSKEAWTLLEQEFQGSDKVQTVKLQTLRMQFQNLRMMENQKVKKYCSQVVELVNQMKTLGDVDMTNQKVVEKLLISLPEQFDILMTAIEESKDLKTLSVQQLTSSLEAYEVRKGWRNIATESAFRAGTKFNPNPVNPNLVKGQNSASVVRWWDICNKGTHDTKSCWSTKICHKCKRKGHIAKFCRTVEIQGGLDRQSEQKEPDTATDDLMTAEHLFYANHSTDKEKGDRWYLDSGCTHHMTGNQHIFSHLDTSFTTRVKMGNGSLVSAKGKGDVQIRTPDGVK